MNYLKTPQNIVIIKADPRIDTLKISDNVGIKIIDYFEPGNWAIVSGTVLAVPDIITENTLGEAYDNDVCLQPGDKVWFHHNVCKPEYQLEPDVYWSLYESFFAYERNGELKCVGDYILVDAILENEDDIRTESGILTKSRPTEKYLRAIVRHVGTPRRREREWYNVKPGDEIIYEVDSDIPLTIGKHNFYRQKFEDIICVDYGSWFDLQGDTICVNAEPREVRRASGIIMPMHKNQPTKSKVLGVGPGVKQVYANDVIYSLNGVGTKVKFSQELLILREWMIEMKENILN